MRILVLCETLSLKDGWGHFSKSTAEGFARQGHQVEILTSEQTSRVKLPKFKEGLLAWMIGGFRLGFWLKRNPFDLIYIPVEPYARLYWFFGRIPFVLTMHGTYVEPKAHGPAWARRAFENALNEAAALTVASAYTFTFLKEDVRPKCRIVPHAVDLSLESDPYATIEKPVGSPIILSVGAIKPRKGFDKLIMGFVEFLKVAPEAKLIIIGSRSHAPFGEFLLSLTRDNGLENKVSFLGSVSQEELLGWYRACDVFALTSVTKGGFEGFGLVYLEANLFGKPSVGNRESGAVSAIREGVSGYLCDADDPKDVSAALQKAVGLDSSAIKNYALEQNWDNRAREYLEIFQNVLNR
ncbi:MAG: glycosyltransferase family 4 protein [Patescibacteria group bacterium]|nr:glycosyltransferase family 4 protein [Patescibacteria group bacterium]